MALDAFTPPPIAKPPADATSAYGPLKPINGKPHEEITKEDVEQMDLATLLEYGRQELSLASFMHDCEKLNKEMRETMDSLVEARRAAEGLRDDTWSEEAEGELETPENEQEESTVDEWERAEDQAAFRPQFPVYFQTDDEYELNCDFYAKHSNLRLTCSNENLFDDHPFSDSSSICASSDLEYGFFSMRSDSYSDLDEPLDAFTPTPTEHIPPRNRISDRDCSSPLRISTPNQLPSPPRSHAQERVPSPRPPSPLKVFDCKGQYVQPLTIRKRANAISRAAPPPSLKPPLQFFDANGVCNPHPSPVLSAATSSIQEDRAQVPDDPIAKYEAPPVIALREFSPEEIQENSIERKVESHTAPVVFSSEPSVHPLVTASESSAHLPAMSFSLVKKLVKGNRSAKIEVVRFIEPLDAQGHGLKPGSLWVLKSHRIPELQRDLSAEQERKVKEARSQFLYEMQAYKRIANAPEREILIGFEFLLTAEATMLHRDYESILLPVAKGDLRTYINYGHLHSSEVPRLMAQMALGIATLHGIGIIHGDIKPENVLLDFRGNVKLADFGLCYIDDETYPLVSMGQYRNNYCGTLGYIAPEKEFATRNTYSGIEADYWALGCIFHEILTLDEGGATEKPRHIIFDDAPRLLEWVQLPETNVERMIFLFPNTVPTAHESNLAIGLLNKRAEYRYSIEHLLLHPYFRRNDGTTEFDHLEESLKREERIPDFPELPAEKAKTITAAYNADSWMNPRGACFRSGDS